MRFPCFFTLQVITASLVPPGISFILCLEYHCRLYSRLSHNARPDYLLAAIPAIFRRHKMPTFLRAGDYIVSPVGLLRHLPFPCRSSQIPFSREKRKQFQFAKVNVPNLGMLRIRIYLFDGRTCFSDLRLETLF